MIEVVTNCVSILLVKEKDWGVVGLVVEEKD